MSSSRSGSVPAFDINGDVDCVFLPDYVEPIVHLTFENEMKFKEWYCSTTQKHATFVYHKKKHTRNLSLLGQSLPCPLLVTRTTYLCNHAKTPSKYIPKNEHAIKRIRPNNSIKIQCPASITTMLFTDYTIQVKYSWTHPNHDPNNITEIAKGRLPLKIRQWIEQHVDAKLNWNAIKNLLRLDNSSLRRVRINLLCFG